MVGSTLRRSNRLREVNNGFEANSCSHRKCLACCPKPPTLFVQSLQSLGFEIYKLNPEDITEEALMKKRKQSSPIAPKKAKVTSGEQQVESMEEGGQHDLD